MTADEMIVFFRERAAACRKGVQRGCDTSNYHLAVLNIGQTFTCHLMAGLIRWRTTSESPADFIADAVHAVSDGLSLLAIFEKPSAVGDIPGEQASICVFLTGLESPMYSEGALKSDRRLDAIIADGLRDQWHEPAWDAALAELRRVKGSRLAVETYSAYRGLLLNQDDASRDDLVRSCEALFKRRARDGFYGGGPQTYGGGPDNAFTVDYRLAAILKKIGYKGQSLHLWRWS